jgi:hypothetical protein
MENAEAATMIRAVADSIRNNPGQFHIEINVTGQHVESHGGTGLSITAVGGGAGSNTIGQIVSLDGSQINIAQKKGAQVMDDQLRLLTRALDSIAIQLESPAPDKGIIKKAYESLKNTWVPGVISSVIGNILTHVGMHFA